eukprot:m.186926 g.186926  ORF g.186926 m.186926 type:complete len:353 (-) comp14767_c1_seq2:248-1306(-)
MCHRLSQPTMSRIVNLFRGKPSSSATTHDAHAASSLSSSHKPMRSTSSSTSSSPPVEHISDRQDHLGHEAQVLRDVVPPAQAQVMKRQLSRTSSKRRSIHSMELDTMELANSQKFNSTSTLFVDSTVSTPDMEYTIKCVARALHYSINEGHGTEPKNLFSDHFDERLHPLTEGRIKSDFSRPPSAKSITSFISKLFRAAALTAECAIIALVYVNRLVAYTHLTLHASNWKRVVLGAILMASKVWDDQAVWNVDFCSILPKVTVESMNDLERIFLEMIDFNIDVESSVYTKYYFELREIAEKFHTEFPLKPMTTERAARLEATSRRHHELAEGGLRKAQSLDGDTFVAKAVLS